MLRALGVGTVQSELSFVPGHSLLHLGGPIDLIAIERLQASLHLSIISGEARQQLALAFGEFGLLYAERVKSAIESGRRPTNSRRGSESAGRDDLLSQRCCGSQARKMYPWWAYS